MKTVQEITSLTNLEKTNPKATFNAASLSSSFSKMSFTDEPAQKTDPFSFLTKSVELKSFFPKIFKITRPLKMKKISRLKNKKILI